MSIRHIEYFKRSINHNAFSHKKIISEQFNDVSSFNNMEFNLFINHIYYWFQRFSGHLNVHNDEFLVLCDTYVYAVLLLVRTINSFKSIVRF